MISLLITQTSKEKYLFLEQLLYICYLLRFWKDTKDVRALIDSGSEINAMTPAYASRLGFQTRNIHVVAQKIDGSTFQTFGMVLASFQVENKLRKTWFFQETFLLADTSVEVMLSILFWPSTMQTSNL